MYKILVNDYINNLQTECCFNQRFLDAKEICLNMALDFVCDKEGIRYLNKPIFYEKKYLQKGYSIVNNSNTLFTKFTVFRKEPNGLIYSGKTEKIISFMTVKHKRETKIETYEEPNEEFKKKFKDVIIDIDAFVPLIEAESENIFVEDIEAKIRNTFVTF